MERPIINFKQERDFNALISDTFEFIRQEFKPLIKSLLTYAGPFILITAFLQARYQSNMYNSLGVKGMSDPLWAFKSIFSTEYFLYIFAYMISNLVLTLVIYSYVKLYVERGKDRFSPEDVWRTLGRYFIPVFFSTLALGLIIAGASLFFVIPGIYLSITTIFTIFIIVAEDKSFGDAMRRSIYLVKDNWWFTLGVLLIMYLIASFSGAVFLIPQIIYTTFITLSIEKGNFEGISLFYQIITAVGTFIATFFYSVVYITISFLYHSYVTQKDKPELLDEINLINEN